MIRASLLGLGLRGLVLSLAVAPAARAEDASSEAILRAQWFTGTLLSPSPGVPHKGILGVEPYLIDKRGRVRYWWYGELNWQGAGGEAFMRGKIEELLAEN